MYVPFEAKSVLLVMLRLSLVGVDVACVLVEVLWYCASSLEVCSPVLLAF
jgi:hypothetical protein